MALLSNVIDHIRKEKGFKKEEFLKKIKMSPPGYKTASEKNDFKYSKLVLMAKVLDISLSFIIIETEKSVEYNENNDYKILKEDPSEYLTEKGRQLLNENIELKKSLEDKDTIIRAYQKLHGKL
jgi:transcriptional regulator with XRE-family HTH domain